MIKFLLAYGLCLQKYKSASYFSWWIQILTNSIALFVSCQFTLCFSPLNICYSAVTCKDIFYWHNLLGWTVTPLFHLSPNRWLFKMTLPLWPFAGTVSFCDKDNTFKGCTTSSVHMNIQLRFFFFLGGNILELCYHTSAWVHYSSSSKPVKWFVGKYSSDVCVCWGGASKQVRYWKQGMLIERKVNMGVYG